MRHWLIWCLYRSERFSPLVSLLHQIQTDQLAHVTLPPEFEHDKDDADDDEGEEDHDRGDIGFYGDRGGA